MTPTDPTASGWSVIEHAPPGPVALTAQQREEVRAERWTPVGDNHHNADACPYCSPHVIAMSKERDEARDALANMEECWKAELGHANRWSKRAHEALAVCAAMREALERAADATDEGADAVMDVVDKALSSSPDAARRYAERVGFQTARRDAFSDAKESPRLVSIDSATR
jgi:hypothetical protein